MQIVNAMDDGGYRVTKAILLHQHSHTDTWSRERRAFATIHDVATPDLGRPEIQAGTILGTDELESALVNLAPERELRFIGPTVLAASSCALVWWRPPAPARIWFN